MSDRRPVYASSNTGSFSAAQWPGSSQYNATYPASQSHYPSPSYGSAAVAHNNPAAASSHHYPGEYMPASNAPIQDTYSYPRSAVSQSVPRTSSSHPYPAYQGVSQPIPIARHPNYVHHPSISTSSYASSQGFASSSPHSPHSPHSPTSPYGYSPSTEGQFPASPQRPFACDQCALSFSRQHDLKRHRDTHTGKRRFVGEPGGSLTYDQARSRTIAMVDVGRTLRGRMH